MKKHPPHPSYFELDRLALEVQDAELADRLDNCDACQEHVQRVRQRLPSPQWVQKLAQPRRAAAPWRAWGSGFLAASMAAVAAVVLFPRLSQHPTHDEVRAKGGPRVTLFVKHEANVQPWDGGPLAPGDHVRLEVNPAGYSFVTVASPSRAGALEVLFQGPLPGGHASLLPQSLRVDDSGEAEHLKVFLTHGPPPADALRADAPSAAQVWTLDLTLPKSKNP